MACQINNKEYEEIINRLESKNIVFPDTFESIDEISNFIDNMTSVLREDNNFRYSIAGVKTGESVTERLNKNKEYLKTMKPVYAETGTFIHKVLEDMFKDHNRSIDELVKSGLAVFNKSDFKNTSKEKQKEIVTGLAHTVKGIISFADKVQKRIDPEGRYIIKSENAIFSPTRNTPGSLDLLILFSNKTAGIIDFKSKPTEKMSDGKNYTTQFDNEGNYTGKKNYRYKFNDYNYQLNEYGKILKEHYGISAIRFGRVIHFPMSIDADTKIIKAFHTSYSAENLRGDMMIVLPENLKDTNLDNWSKEMISRIKNSKSSAERDRLSEELDEVLVKHNFDLMVKDIMSNIAKVNKMLNSEASIEDIGNELNKLQGAKRFVVNLETYINELYKNEKTHAERIANLHKIKNQLSNQIDELSTKVLNYISGNTIGENLYDEKSGDFLADRYTGYYSAQVKTLSGENNRWFQLLNSFKEEINYGIEKDLKHFYEDWRKYLKVIDDFVKQNSRKVFEDLLINPKTNNLYSRITPEYYDTMNSDKVSLKWLKENRKPKSFYTKEEYQKRLVSYTEFIDNLDKTDLEKKNAIQAWVERHDIFSDKYTAAWKNTSITDISEQGFEKYKSEQYKKIEERGLSEFYNWYYKTMYELLHSIGANDRFTGNFIPEIRMSMLEKFNSGQLNESVTDKIFDSIKSNLAIQPQNKHEFSNNKEVPVYFLYPEQTKNYEKSRNFMLSLALFAKMAYNYKYATQYQGAIEAVSEIFNNPEVKFRKTTLTGNAYDSLGNEIGIVDNPQYKAIFNAYKNNFLYGSNPDMTDDRTLFKLQDGREITLYNTLKALKNHTTLATLSLKPIGQAVSFLQGSLSKYVEGGKGMHFNRKDSTKAIRLIATDKEKSLAIAGAFEIFSDDLTGRYANEDTKWYSLVDKSKGGLARYVNSRGSMSGWRLESELRDIHLVNTVAMRYMYNPKEFDGIRKIHSYMLDADNNLKQEYKDQGYIVLRDGLNYKDGELTAEGLNEKEFNKMAIAFRAAARQIKFSISGELTDNDKTILQQSIFGQFLLMYKTWLPGIIRERFSRTQYEHITQTLRSGRYVEGYKYLFSKDDEVAGNVIYAMIAKRLLTFGLHLLNPLNLMGSDKYSIKQNEQSLRLEYEMWIKQNKDIYNQMKGTKEEKFLQFQQLRNGQLRALVSEIQIGMAILTAMGLISAGWHDDKEKNWAERKSYALLRKLSQEMTFIYNPIALNDILKNPLPVTTTAGQVYNSFANGLDEIRDHVFGKDYKGFFVWQEDKKDKTGFGHYSLGLVFPGFSGLASLFDFRESDKTYGLK